VQSPLEAWISYIIQMTLNFKINNLFIQKENRHKIEHFICHINIHKELYFIPLYYIAEYLKVYQKSWLVRLKQMDTIPIPRVSLQYQLK
jgi:hypothetical protein